jgi:hypothetical protein
MARKKTIIKVLKGFVSGGVDYAPGSVIDPESPKDQDDLSRWPDDALKNRLNNGFLTYDTVDIEEKAAEKSKKDEK